MEENALTGETVVTTENAEVSAESAAAGQDSGNLSTEDPGTGNSGEKTERENLDEEFERLIKGRYRDTFAKRTQQVINRRFKEMKELEEFRARTLEGERDRTRRERAEAALGVASEYAKILAGAEEAKTAYPSFDLEAECRDRTFRNLIAAGLSVKSAYEALHHGEIVAGAMQYAADRVYEAAQYSAPPRPVENGTTRGMAADLKRDVSKLGASEIKDILRRVEKGEKIKF